MDGTTPAGVTEGRSVHYVTENGEHRAATITGVPGTLFFRNAAGDLVRVPDHIVEVLPGCVDLAVFASGTDVMEAVRRDAHAKAVSVVTGATYDEETKAPCTWHFIEGAAQRQAATPTPHVQILEPPT